MFNSKDALAVLFTQVTLMDRNHLEQQYLLKVYSEFQLKSKVEALENRLRQLEQRQLTQLPII